MKAVIALLEEMKRAGVSAGVAARQGLAGAWANFKRRFLDV